MRPASAGPFFDGVYRVTFYVGAATLLATVALVCSEAFLRSLFNFSLGFSEELTGYFLVSLTLNGAALALRERRLFQVEFLLHRTSLNVQRGLNIIFGFLILLVCVVLAFKTMDLAMSSLARGKFAATVLRTPLWIPQLLMPLGFGVLGLFVVEQLWLTAVNPCNASPVKDGRQI